MTEGDGEGRIRGEDAGKGEVWVGVKDIDQEPWRCNVLNERH